MAKVNLLPSEFGGTKQQANISTFDLRKVIRFLYFLCIIFFLVGIFLKLDTISKKRGLYRVSQEYKEKQDIRKKIDELKKKEAALLVEMDTLNGYLKREVFWSEKLEQLRQIVPGEVWLTSLSFEKKPLKDKDVEYYFGNLILKGSLIAKDKESPIGTLSIFVNKIKEDEAFFEDFDNINLSDFRMEQYKDREIMTFFIEMPFKTGIFN